MNHASSNAFTTSSAIVQSVSEQTCGSLLVRATHAAVLSQGRPNSGKLLEKEQTPGASDSTDLLDMLQTRRAYQNSIAMFTFHETMVGNAA